MPSERTLRSWGWMAVTVVGGIVIWVGPVMLLSHHGALGLTDTARLLARVVAASLAMAWAIVFAALAYRARTSSRRKPRSSPGTGAARLGSGYRRRSRCSSRWAASI